MRTKVCILMCLYLSLCGGCGSTSYQRLDALENVVAVSAKASVVMSTQLDVLKTSLTEIQKTLADPNIAVPEREKINEALSKTIAEIVSITTKKAQIDEKINEWLAKIEMYKQKEVSIADELVLYGQAASEFGPLIPPPIGPYVTLAGFFVGILGTVWAKKQKAVSKGLVGSVDKLLSSSTVSDAGTARSILKKEQERLGVREAVKKLL